MLKNMLMKKMIKSQMKGVPEAEQEKIIKLVTENPELFQEIGVKIKARMKNGEDQQKATMAVMMEYRDQIQKLMPK